MASDSTAPRVIDGLVLKATAVTAKRVGVALGKCTAVRSAHGNTSVKRWPKHDALGGPNRPPIVDVPPNRRKTRTPWPFVSIEPPSPTLEPLSIPLTWLNLLRVLSATATQEADPLSPPPPRDTIHAHCDTASERSLASCLHEQSDSAHTVMGNTMTQELGRFSDARDPAPDSVAQVIIKEYTRGASRSASHECAHLQPADDAAANSFTNSFTSVDIDTVVAAPAHSTARALLLEDVDAHVTRHEDGEHGRRGHSDGTTAAERHLLRVLSATATQEADPLSPPHRVTQYTPTAIQLRSGAWPHAHSSRVTAMVMRSPMT